MDASDHFAAGRLERLAKRFFGIEPRAVVGDDGVDLLDAVLRRPARHGLRDLRQRHRYADDVGRARRDDRSRGVHDDHRLLRLARDRRHRERVGREPETDQHIDVVAGDQFLRESLGDIGRRAGGVLLHDFDLLASDGVTVLLHVRLHAAKHLLAVLREGSGELRHHAQLHHTLRVRGPRHRQQANSRQRASHHVFEFHDFLLINVTGKARSASKSFSSG